MNTQQKTKATSRERRKANRCRLISHVSAFDCTSGLLLGRVKDISSGGLSVVGDRHVPPGTELRFWIEFPRGNTGEKKKKALVAGRSVWSRCQSDKLSRYVETGFRLMDLTREAAATLRSLPGVPQCSSVFAETQRKKKNWSGLVKTYSLIERRESELPPGTNVYRNGYGRIWKNQSEADSESTPKLRTR